MHSPRPFEREFQAVRSVQPRVVLVVVQPGRGSYQLADIVEHFQLGRLEEAGGENEAVLVLTGKELQSLKSMADSFSFDYEEEFIEMCLELTRFAAGLAAAPDALEIRFTEYF